MQRGNHLLSCCVLSVWDSCRRAPTSNPDQLQMWCCCMRRLLRAACSAGQNGGDCCGCAGGSPHHRDHACNLLDRYLLSALCRHAHLPNALVQQEISGATYTTKCWAYSIEWKDSNPEDSKWHFGEKVKCIRGIQTIDTIGSK